MSRETTLAKIAAMAQLLDDAGLYDDATILDNAVGEAAGLRKEAGFWQAVLSRMSGWARRILFKEYRELYAAAKEAQAKADERMKELQAVNEELREMLARHMLVDWRDGLAVLLPAITVSADEALSPYDEQRAKMVGRLLKITPKKKPEGPAVPPLMPEDKPEPGKPPASPAAPEEPIPLTKVKKPGPVAPPEVPPAVAPEEPKAPSSAPAAPSEWRKERFGRSGARGHDWEWEVSADGNRMRMPKATLAIISSGKGKIMHKRQGKYYPTGTGQRAGLGATSSAKLRNLMGRNFWQEEDDPSDPNMAILVRTDEQVPFPAALRPEPVEQAERLKELGKSSAERMDRLMAVAAEELLGGEPSDEEMLDRAAKALLEGFEHEEMEEEEEV